MPLFASADTPVPARPAGKGNTRHIVGFVYFTFICYISIGLPLAVLPSYVHLRVGYSTVLAGLTISIMYIATIICRPWAGRFCDHVGAKASVLGGMVCCAASGVFLVGTAALASIHWLSFAILIASRLILGVGESTGSTGSSLWGITSAGPEHTAKVISLNGISVYGGVALGAPLGVILDQRWGLASIGAVTILICAVSFAVAWRKSPVAVAPGEPLSFIRVLGRVTPLGTSLALSGVSYGVLATFVTLFYASRHWNGAALCLTAYGVAYIAVRVFFTGTVNHYGGFPVAMVSFFVTSLGMLLLWRASSPWMALSGATVNGLGSSLIFPALGVEAFKRVPESNRGACLAVFVGFFDVSFLLIGPLAGAIIGVYGYASVYLLGLISVLAALAIVVVLRQVQKA